MAEVIVTVGKDGSTKVAVQGVSGPGCRELTAALEAALGKVEEMQHTPEYYEEERQEVEGHGE